MGRAVGPRVDRRGRRVPLPGGGDRRLAAAVLAGAVLAVGLGALAAALGRGSGEAPRVHATLSAVGALAGADTAGYARAFDPPRFSFPRDHGAHPAFRTEWWYVTGNLEAEDGRRFGYQLTFFRNAFAPDTEERSSAWNTNQLWMAHLALTDVAGERHLATERFSREAVGLAGARVRPFRVWLHDWELREEEPDAAPDPSPSAGLEGASGILPLRLEARHAEWGLELTLEEGKPAVPQGEGGLSRKGPEPGNASHYFSFPRLPTHGVVVLDGEPVRVRGESWIDREWSTSALGEEHVGWDWFSIQLDDGHELMFFELRRADGRPDPLDHGILVRPDGGYRPLAAGEVSLEVTGTWASPLDGTTYPSGWLLDVPSEGIRLELDPVLADQEMNLSVRYWEGAIEARGSGPRGPARGRGFAELTGYGENPGDGRFGTPE